MLFKVKDLLVTLIPGADAADCAPDTRCNGCTNQYSDCPGGCSNARSDFSDNCPAWRYEPADLNVLQTLLRYSQLKSELASLEAALRSPADLDDGALRARLEGVLAQVEHALKVDDPQEVAAVRTPVFRVNDLLVTVLPQVPEGADSGCPGCTCAGGCSGPTGCTNASTKIDGPDWAAAVLPQLQAALTAAVGTVDDAPVGQALTSHSRREVELLATHLKEALDALGTVER